MKRSKGRILALDYGSKRIGAAVSDPLRITAQGIGTIEYRNLTDALQQIKHLIRKYSVTEILVGLPLNLKGQMGHAAQKTKQLIERLEAETEVPALLWDERFSSAEAERTLITLGKSPSRHRKKIDEMAAVLILQSYLDSPQSKR